MKALCVTVGLLLAASAAHGQAADGAALYQKNCRMCHGAEGTPPATMLKLLPTLPTLNAKYLGSRSADSIVKVLTNGTANGKMKPLKEKMTPGEMKLVAEYVKEMVKPKGGGS